LETIYDSLHNSTQPFFLVKEVGGIAVVGLIEQFDEFFSGVAPENVIRPFCARSLALTLFWTASYRLFGSICSSRKPRLASP